MISPSTNSTTVSLLEKVCNGVETEPALQPVGRRLLPSGTFSVQGF